MLKFFIELKRFFHIDDIWIDNVVFRLHYKATVIMFLTASLLVTSRQYFGDPIDCVVSGVPPKIMDTYCWIHSTFSIPTRWTGVQGIDIPHAGVAPEADLAVDNPPVFLGLPNQEDVPQNEKKYHKYYQWVCFMLFFHAVMFYIPRYIWKSSEGGKVRMLIGYLHENLMLTADQKRNEISVSVKYFKLHRGTHFPYALRFFVCEFLNFINVVGQLYFIDVFLDNEFSKYGMEVIKYAGMEGEDRPDPMAKVFPKVTKCTFHKYGPSGTIAKHDGLCVLPINIINEKIYIFIWFWLVLLASVTAAFLIYRTAVIIAPGIRVSLISVKGGKSTKSEDVEEIIELRSLTFLERLGDWFLLNLMCRNLNSLLVNDLIKQLRKEEKCDNSTNVTTETLRLESESASI